MHLQKKRRGVLIPKGQIGTCDLTILLRMVRHVINERAANLALVGWLALASLVNLGGIEPFQAGHPLVCMLQPLLFIWSLGVQAGEPPAVIYQNDTNLDTFGSRPCPHFSICRGRLPAQH
jgi:hypothetical protein